MKINFTSCEMPRYYKEPNMIKAYFIFLILILFSLVIRCKNKNQEDQFKEIVKKAIYKSDLKKDTLFNKDIVIGLEVIDEHIV